MTKTINELTPLDLTGLNASSIEFGIDNAGVNPKTSNKISLAQIRGPATYDIWPTGTGSVDTPAFESLVRSLPVGTGGTVRVMDNGSSLVLDPAYSVAGTSGGVKVSASFLGVIEVDKPFRLIGETRNSHVTLKTVATSVGAYRIVWGDTTNWYTSASRVAIDPTPAGSISISGWPANYLKRGDWVLMSSTDNVPNVSPHNSLYGGTQKPGELKHVAYVANINGVDHAFLDGATIDDMITSPTIIKLSLLSDCGIENLTVGSGRSLSSESSFESGSAIILAFDVQRTIGFRVFDVTIDDTTAGALRINTSANVMIEGYNGLGVPDNSVDYGVIAMSVNGFTFRDSVWHNSRHVFTTGGNQLTNVYDRAGTPLNVFVHNVTAYQAGSRNSDILTGFDSHAEGYGVVFDSCRVFAGGSALVRQCGFGGRSRNSVYRNCSFVDKRRAATGRRNEGYAFVISGANTVIDGGYVEGAAIGVQPRTFNTGPSPTFTPLFQHNMRISNVHFEDVWGTTLFAEYANDGLLMDNCSMRNSATWMSGSGETGVPQFVRAAIQIYAGTGHKIRGNFFDCESNDYILHPYANGPSQIQIVGNHCRGYTQRFTQGTDKIGIRGDSGDPNGVAATTGAQALQTTFEHQNYTS